MVATALSDHYDVVTASDGRECLEQCRQGNVSVVITDIGMPGMDGLRLLREMKKGRQTAAIPVIILTASHFNTLSRSQFMLDPQVRVILQKPCPIVELTAAVRSALHPPKP